MPVNELNIDYYRICCRIYVLGINIIHDKNTQKTRKIFIKKKTYLVSKEPYSILILSDIIKNTSTVIRQIFNLIRFTARL